MTAPGLSGTLEPMTRALSALPLVLAGAAACTASAPDLGIIPTPSHTVLERAWRSIGDPQLAAQLRPEGPFAPAACVVHLGVWRAHATAAQRVAIDRASDAWRSAVRAEFGGSEIEAQQMIASSVNPLADTPAPLRQAAAAWCVAHAPAK